MEKLPSIIHESWHEYLQPLFDNDKMKMIRDEVLAKEKFYPPKKEIFRVFSMPIDKVKVVILGQDPYPKQGQANGLAFAVNQSIVAPASLKVIQMELKLEEKGLNFYYKDKTLAPEWKTLEHWFKQGVFLLNTGLTVKAGESGSHLLRWQWFTREIIRIVSINSTSKVWLMWGAKAKAYTGLIHKYYLWRDKFEGNYNYVLQADHPAAETYPGSKGKFIGCNHFNITNEILKHFETPQIFW